MSMKYIRETYHVPAKRGASILYCGLQARIIGSYGPYLKIKVKADRFSRIVHPRDDQLQYVDVLPQE